MTSFSMRSAHFSRRCRRAALAIAAGTILAPAVVAQNRPTPPNANPKPGTALNTQSTARNPKSKPELPPAVKKAVESFNRAVALQRASKASEAVAEYKKFIALSSEAKLAPAFTLPAYKNLVVLYEFQSNRPGLEDALKHVVQIETKNASALSQLATLAGERKDFTNAQVYANRALALKPAANVAAAAHFVLGVAGSAQGKLAVAEREFAAVVKLAPANPQGHYYLGLTLGQEKKYKPALVELQTAQKMAPNLPRLGPAIALLKMQSGDKKGALSAYESTLRSNPQDVAAAYNRALLLEQSGRTEDAISAYLKVLALAPNNTDAQGRVGLLYAKIGNFTAARTHYARALASRPRDPRLFVNLGLAEQQEGFSTMSLPGRQKLLAQAETHLLAAKRLAGKNAEAMALDARLADLYARMGRYEDALAIYRRQQAAHPDDVDVYRQTAMLYTMQRKPDDILKTWAAYRVRRPDDPISYDESAGILESQDKMNEAIQERQKLIARKPKPGVVATQLVGIGQDFARQKKLKEAREAFSSALAVTPDIAASEKEKAEQTQRIETERMNALRGLAQAAESEEKLDEAIQTLNQLKQIEAVGASRTQASPPAQTYNDIARLYEKIKRPELAVAEYRALALVRPADPTPFVSIARIEDTQDHLDSAVTAYRDAMLRAQPTQALDYRLQIAELYRKRKQFDKAIDEFESARRENPTQTRMLPALAETYQQNGQDDKALGVYDAYAKSNPKLDWIDDRKATILMRLKRYPEAQALYEKRLNANPEDYQAYIDLRNVYAQEGQSAAFLPWLRSRLEKTPAVASLMAVTLDQAIQEKKDDEGWAFLSTVAEKNAANRTVQQNYADLLTRRGKGKDALPVYRRIAAMTPNDVNAQVTLASQLDLTENTDEANKLFEKLIARPDLTEVQRLNLRRQAADRYRRQNKPVEAIRQFREIVKATSDEDIYPRAALAYLLTTVNRDAEAIPIYNALVRRNDIPARTRASFLTELGGIAEKQGKKADALIQYREALKLNPQEKKATDAIARLAPLPAVK